MDNYITGSTIRRLRENKKMTQDELAEKIFVSNKAVSKWENGHGLPDISLLEPLAKALDISVIELFSGNEVRNKNRAFNMEKIQFYVCPICGNVIQATGEAVISCCGITLPPLEAETIECGSDTSSYGTNSSGTSSCDNCGSGPCEEHRISVQKVEDEYFVSINHPMTKEHYISFIAAVADNGVQFVKLYPESAAEARFKINRVRFLLTFCNRHGLFKAKI
jgi:DNA-binding XRE family transcriptional regulator